MLKVCAPSPPVPTTSSSSGRGVMGRWTAFSRMAWANPAISAAVFAAHPQRRQRRRHPHGAQLARHQLGHEGVRLLLAQHLTVHQPGVDHAGSRSAWKARARSRKLPSMVMPSWVAILSG